MNNITKKEMQQHVDEIGTLLKASKGKQALDKMDEIYGFSHHSKNSLKSAETDELLEKMASDVSGYIMNVLKPKSIIASEKNQIILKNIIYCAMKLVYKMD
jgi:hypothetical protein